MPKLADHFFLRVGFSESWFHVWDLHGLVGSTQDSIELARWIALQQKSGSYFGLREALFPGFVAARQEVIGALGSGHTRLGRGRHQAAPRSAPINVKDGDDLLDQLGL